MPGLLLPDGTISIHALHEESDRRLEGDRRGLCGISIHALHEESDVSAINKTPKLAISIHALHEESDLPCR